MKKKHKEDAVAVGITAAGMLLALLAYNKGPKLIDKLKGAM